MQEFFIKIQNYLHNSKKYRIFAAHLVGVAKSDASTITLKKVYI